MSCIRFLKIKKILHFADNNELEESNKMNKTRLLVCSMNTKLHQQRTFCQRTFMKKWNISLVVVAAKCLSKEIRINLDINHRCYYSPMDVLAKSACTVGRFSSSEQYPQVHRWSLTHRLLLKNHPITKFSLIISSQASIFSHCFNCKDFVPQSLYVKIAQRDLPRNHSS